MAEALGPIVQELVRDLHSHERFVHRDVLHIQAAPRAGEPAVREEGAGGREARGLPLHFMKFIHARLRVLFTISSRTVLT